MRIWKTAGNCGYFQEVAGLVGSDLNMCFIPATEFCFGTSFVCSFEASANCVCCKPCRY